MSAISIEFPAELVEKIDKLAGGPANRTHFLTDLIDDEVMRQNQIAAIQQSTGAWSDDSGAEWAGMDSADYVSMVRHRSIQDFKSSEES